MKLSVVPTQRRKVLDISRWQSRFDAKTAKAQGIQEIVCRASYGRTKDAKVDKYAAEALKEGLPLSAYSFCTAHYASVCGGNVATAIEIAKSQANAFVYIAKSIGVNGFLALDVELESGHRLGLNRQQLTDMCNAYLNVLAAAGYPAMLYMSVSAMMTWLYVDQIQYPLWAAYYYKYGNKLNFSNDPNKGVFPSTGYGNWLRARSANVAMWQFTSEGYAALYGCGTSDAAGLDKNWGYYSYSSNESNIPENEKKGVQFMKTVDVYASITQSQTGGNRFNVQGFATPDINGKVLTDDKARGLADGRYWCNATGLKLKGLDGYEGAEIQVGDTIMYIAIIPGATEYAEISSADAYRRFMANKLGAGYSEAEQLELQAQLASTQAERDEIKAKLAEAEAKIETAKDAVETIKNALK